MIRCGLAERYARWAGLEPQEPRWGWIWSVTLHALVVLGVAAWTALALSAFAWLVSRA